MALVGACAAALTATAVVVSLASSINHHRGLVAVSHALLIATPVAVGLYALRRQPENRFARLLIAAGFLWAPSLLAASSNSTLYSLGRVAGWMVSLTLVGLVLAFPAGRLEDRASRTVVLVAAALVVFLYLPTVLLSAHYPEPSPWSGCRHACPPNAFAVTHPEPHVMSALIEPAREVLAVAVFLAAAAILALRIGRASRLMRQTLTPVLVTAIFALGTEAAFLVARRVDKWSGVTEAVGFVSVLAASAVVLGFLVGLLRWRLRATTALRRLADEFGHARSRAGVRALIANTIGDPSLEIAYWSEHPGRWVDAAGTPVTLPRDDPTRAVTEVGAQGETVAALIHDAALEPEPALREVASGFALMALENQRLDAELRASLRELRESRARILTAVDVERSRIERDLHDGAQQRLVALRVALQTAADVAERDTRAATQLLDGLGDDVEATLDELRSLARGVYPPLLADHGIGEALRLAAQAGPLDTTVRSRGVGRYSQQVEAAVYFCCLEALQNAAKHSGARHATVTLSEDEDLRFEVRDDGLGIRDPSVRGAGLDNMRDRIVSLGGRLTIESASGQGTRVIGTVPVGVAQLTPDVEMLFQRTTDALDDCFALYRAVRDSNGQVVDFIVEHLNDAACRETGRARELQVGRTLGRLELGYLASEEFEWHCQALEADGPSTLEDLDYDTNENGRRLRKAYEVRAAPLGGGRLAVTWRDITERKRREQELLLQSTALSSMAEGVALIRCSDGVIVYANPRFAEVFGYEPDELPGLHAADLRWNTELDQGKVWVTVQQDVITPRQDGDGAAGARHPAKRRTTSSR
ncbi:MAG TPA: histidine kinase [Thermoleophilaceae bacterium]